MPSKETRQQAGERHGWFLMSSDGDRTGRWWFVKGSEEHVVRGVYTISEAWLALITNKNIKQKESL